MRWRALLTGREQGLWQWEGFGVHHNNSVGIGSLRSSEDRCPWRADTWSLKRCHINSHHLPGARNWGSSEEIGFIFLFTEKRVHPLIYLPPAALPIWILAGGHSEGFWLEYHSLRSTEQPLTVAADGALLLGSNKMHIPNFFFLSWR